MNHKKYMSIGRAAKLTGVHIKSLRYYDEIGVLHPAYVEQSSGYRYYSEQQLILIETIKFCIEMGIPLKDFHKILSDNGKKINFTELIEYGTLIAKEKIRTINGRLKLLDEFQKEIIRAEELKKHDDIVEYNMPERRYSMALFKGKRGDYSFDRELDNLILKAKSLNLNIGYEMGILKYFKKDEIKQFVFIEIMEKKGYKDLRTVLIPEGIYFCKKTIEPDIENAEIHFSELFKSGKEKIIIETELFTGDYDFTNPMFELRYRDFDRG